jgi:serine protease
VILLAGAVAVTLATRVSVGAQQPTQSPDVLHSEADPARLAAFVAALEQNLPYVPGELLVRFRPGFSTARQAAALSALRTDFSQSRSFWIKDTLVVTGLPADDAERSASILRGQPEVAVAQPNYIRHLQSVPNDPGYSRQWNMDDIQMLAAWNINKGAGQGVTVAVLDSGLTNFDGTYSVQLPIPPSGLTFGLFPVPFLKAQDFDFTRVLPGAEFTSTGPWAVAGQPVLFDAFYHGTHVAGTIAQQTNNNFGFAGVANGVTLMPVKVCSSDLDLVMAWGRDKRLPTGASGCTDDAIIRGIHYAVDNGAKVLNMSLGGGPANPLVQAALNEAVSKGAFVAIAAGNNALLGNPVIYPAAYAAGIPGVVAVGATTRNRTRALYSSYGSYVELVAPGGEGGNGVCASDSEIVWQKAPDPFYFTQVFPPRFDQYKDLGDCGTSMASPHVAGAAALLYSQGITDPAAIESALERFAVHLGTTPGRSDEYGYGLIDVRATLLGFGFNK